jgi:hypothetical protein
MYGLQATAMKDPTKPVADEAPIHRIRITLTSRNVKSLEKGNDWTFLICRCPSDQLKLNFLFYLCSVL